MGSGAAPLIEIWGQCLISWRFVLRSKLSFTNAGRDENGRKWKSLKVGFPGPQEAPHGVQGAQPLEAGDNCGIHLYEQTLPLITMNISFYTQLEDQCGFWWCFWTNQCSTPASWNHATLFCSSFDSMKPGWKLGLTHLIFTIYIQLQVDSRCSPLKVTKDDSRGSPLQVTKVNSRGSPLQATSRQQGFTIACNESRPSRQNELLSCSSASTTTKSHNVGEVKSQFLPFNLKPALSLFMNRLSHIAAFFEGKRSGLNAITAQPSTSSGLPTSCQCSLANTDNVILNDNPPENQFTADSDSGEETNAQVELSINPNDATDSNPTGSVSASCTGSFQLHCGSADLVSLGTVV